LLKKEDPRRQLLLEARKVMPAGHVRKSMQKDEKCFMTFLAIMFDRF
jgi:hypothetical protein